MHNFLANNRDELIARCEARVSRRPRRAASVERQGKGVSLFLEQLRRTLLAEEEGKAGEDQKNSESSCGDVQTLSAIGVLAAARGKQLLELGYSVDQVVHDFDDLSQAISDLAAERHESFSIDELRTLNRCLDSAIADAVTELGVERDATLARQQAAEVKERIGFFAHELRNSVDTATLAVSALERGNLPISGATGGVLKRSLAALTTQIDSALDEVRGKADAAGQSEPFSLAMFIADAASEAALDAGERGCEFAIPAVDHLLGIAGNRDRLLAALGELLHNAFKFTHPRTDVTLLAYPAGDRVNIEVEDHCGGLSPGQIETMFGPFLLRSDEKTDLGLGLSLTIARQIVEADGGTLRVRNVSETGCVFTISLPRHVLK